MPLREASEIDEIRPIGSALGLGGPIVTPHPVVTDTDCAQEEPKPTDATDTRAAGDPSRSLASDLVGSIGLYTVAMIVSRAMSLLLLPLYTRYLNRTDYGVLELLDLLMSITAVVVGVRLGQALFYFYYTVDDDRERRRLVSTAFLGAALLGVITAVVGLLLAVPLSRVVFDTPQYASLVRIAFLGFAGSMPVEIGFCYLRVRGRARLFLGATTVRLALNVAVNVVCLVVLKLGVASLLWSAVISTSCLALYFAWEILKNEAGAFHRAIFSQMVRYSLPLGVSAFGDFVLHFGDRLFLRGVVPLADLGLYGLAYKVGMVVPSATGPFFTYWNAQMVGIVKQPRGEEVYARMATYLLLGVTTLVLLLTVFSAPLLAVLTESSFHGAAVFVPWLAVAYLVRAMGSYWSNTFLLEKRPGLVARVTWFGSGACLVSYAVLVPRYHLWGAVIATMVGFVLMAAFAFVMSQRVHRFEYEYGRWGKIVGCGMLSSAPALLVHPVEFSTQIALGTACICMFAGLLLGTRAVTVREQRTLGRALRSLLSPSSRATP